MKRSKHVVLIVILAALPLVVFALLWSTPMGLAQGRGSSAAPDYYLDWWTVDGGGETLSGAGFTL